MTTEQREHIHEYHPAERPSQSFGELTCRAPGWCFAPDISVRQFLSIHGVMGGGPVHVGGRWDYRDHPAALEMKEAHMPDPIPVNRTLVLVIDDDPYTAESLDDALDVQERPGHHDVRGALSLADAADLLPRAGVVVLDAVGCLGGFHDDDSAIEERWLALREQYAGPVIVYTGLPGMVDWLEDDRLTIVTKGSSGALDLLEIIDRLGAVES